MISLLKWFDKVYNENLKLKIKKILGISFPWKSNNFSFSFSNIFCADGLLSQVCQSDIRGDLMRGTASAMLDRLQLIWSSSTFRSVSHELAIRECTWIIQSIAHMLCKGLVNSYLVIFHIRGKSKLKKLNSFYKQVTLIFYLSI